MYLKENLHIDQPLKNDLKIKITLTIWQMVYFYIRKQK